MRTILGTCDGFTPIIDVVADKMGLIPAAVYGVVWRYCQMRDGVCYATLETLAGHLGCNPATVLRHIKSLCSEGFLEDTTPNLKNKPHTYRDTGRVVITTMVQAHIAERNVTLQSATSHCTEQRHVAESQLKILRGDKLGDEEENNSAAPDGADASGSTDPLSVPGSPISAFYFGQFGRSRWATPAQKALFLKTEQEVGGAIMRDAVLWGAQNNISRVSSICTTAKKMTRHVEASGLTALVNEEALANAAFGEGWDADPSE